MCSGRAAGVIADPANVFGKRPGGMNMANALDPGGAIVEATTGSKAARKIADPGKLFNAYDSEENYKQTQEAYAKVAPLNEEQRRSRTTIIGSTAEKPKRNRVQSLYGEIGQIT